MITEEPSTIVWAGNQKGVFMTYLRKPKRNGLVKKLRRCFTKPFVIKSAVWIVRVVDLGLKLWERFEND